VTAVAITEPGAFIPASVCASIRHGLIRDLDRALREQARVPADVEDAIRLIDNVGAWAANKNLPSDVPSNVPSFDNSSSEVVRWVAVKTAAEELNTTTRAVTGLLTRGSLHGEKRGREWFVDAAAVKIRKDALA
jgi:hypothetical protein